MTQATRPELPPPLAAAWLQIENWRANKRSRRMPEALWLEAVDLAAEFGVYRASHALRLNYASLKERVESAAHVAKSGLDVSPPPSPPAPPVFVDLMPRAPVAAGEGTVEMIATDGAMMRIEWGGGCSPDMASVVDAFFGSRS